MRAKDIIRRVIKEKWKLILFLSIFTLLFIATRVASPFVIKSMMDNKVSLPVNEQEVNNLVLPTIILVGLSVLGFVFNSLRCSFTANIGSEITLGLKTEAYSTVLRADLMEINKLDTDETFKAIEDSTRRIGHVFFGDNLITFCTNALIYISLLVTLFILDGTMGAIALAGSVIFFAVHQIISFILLKQAYKHEKMRQSQDDIVSENIKSIKQLKVRNSLAAEEEGYKAIAKKLERSAKLKSNLESQEGFLINEFIVNLTIVAAFGILGAAIAVSNNKSFGTMLGYIYLIPTLYSVLHNLLRVSPLPSIATSAFEEINSVLSIRQENRVVTVKELSEIYSLQFDDVSFEYSPDSSFKLEHISFEVRKGESLGILGLTNSGKSTIVDLATKIIRPKQGKVLVNNCDVNKLDTYYLRDQIATVSQDAKLYRGTIEHNVIYPLPMDEYRYNDALNRCHLKPLVNGLPKHDQTVIDDDTDLLTPIEKQKLLLANAFYKDAKICLFDDSTSKFDALSEKEMMDEILKLKNKITIIVSNRISSLVKCSKILILNGGKVVEYGDIEKLIGDEKSAFAKMVKETKSSRKIS